MASPLDHAWYVLKAPQQRDATPISMSGGNAPVRSHDDMGMGSSPGGRRASENNAIKREMLRQQKDAQEGENRDPLEMEEEEQMVSEMAPEHFQQERPKPDPVSPEFIQQLMAAKRMHRPEQSQVANIMDDDIQRLNPGMRNFADASGKL